MGSLTPEYLFFFQDIDSGNRSLTKLKHDLDGWKSYGVSFGRETDISNVVKSYTQSWTFIKEDALYLKQKLFTYGPNRRIRLIVKRLNDYMTENYVVEYSGYIDLTQLEIEGSCVSAPVTEGGFFKTLENRWNEDFRIQLDSVCNVTGASFSEFVQILNEQQIENESCNHTSGIGYVLLGGNINNQENISEEFFQETNARYINATSNINQPNDQIIDSVSESDAFFIMRSNIIQSMCIDFDLTLNMQIREFHTFASLNRSKYRLFLVSTDYANVQNGGSVVLENGVNATFIELQYVEQIHTLVNGWGTQNYSIEFSGEYNLSNYDCSNGKVFFLMARIKYGDASSNEMFGGNNSGWDYRYPAEVNYSASQSFVSLSYESFNVSCSFETQIVVNQRISVIPAVEVFRQLIVKIRENYIVQMNLESFDDIAKDDLLTSGSGLRGVRELYQLYNPRGYLETSIEKFLKFCMVVYNYKLGLDYDRENDIYTIYLAHFDTYYQSNNCITNVSSINKYKVSIDREKLYSSIKCGYETRDDALNGLSEYNCIYNWLTPNTQIEEKELDLVSPYSASTRTIETYIYENYENEKDSDEKDNEIFIIGAKWQNLQHLEVIDYSAMPKLNVIDSAWNDTLVVINNPANNGGYSFTAYTWYKNDFNEVIGTGQYISGLNLSDTSNIYFCVLITTNNECFLSMWPFDADYILPESDALITDVNIYNIRRDIQVNAGLVQPQNAWNIDFTPKRIMLNHAKELFSYFSFEVGKSISLNTCERNSELVAGGISESADIVIRPDNLFMPIIIEISTPVSKRLISQIENNRKGYFKFEFQGKIYKGFIAEGSDSITINPMEEKESTIKMIAEKTCDFL